ncbi:MAG: 2-amino-4-hydroxy-6-hydroxymethyldihydropteridine diphosphokinase [Chloroflexota bacterium]
MSHHPVDVLLGLGSNIDRQRNLSRAIQMLGQHPDFALCAVSPIYESLPVGGQPGQSPYYNAAAHVKTALSPAELKSCLRQIEQDLGRVRIADKYSPHPIDIDIVMYGKQIFELEGKQIPDPHLLQYPYIAHPIADIAADWIHPENGLSLRQIAESLTYSETEIYQI